MTETRPVTPADQIGLYRYLPDRLWTRWQNGSTVPGLRHLQDILRAVLTYLPRRVARAGLSTPNTLAVSGVFAQATLMFADISGFTAMSERLTLLGREGAEVIAGIVNGYFAAMLEIIARYDGDLFKFGGDALLVSFSGNDNAVRGCLAALEMQRAMARFAVVETVQGVFNLRMTAGLGTGTLYLANLGSADRIEFAVMGPALEQMARAEDLSEAGDVVIDRATYERIESEATVREQSTGFYLLTKMSAPVVRVAAPPFIPPAADAHWLVERLDALTPFLPPGILERIVASPRQRMIEGEHRPVTVMFANFYGINALIEALGPDRNDELMQVLNGHFTAMRDIISKYGGIVNKVDSYAVGYRIMALFGAPIAHEDDPARAVRAGLEMQEAMERFANLSTGAGSFSLKQRIGINTGYVFAGNLGSTLRQEYSVMGDEVNLTSRLMGVAAEGEVLVSHSTARHVKELFERYERDPVKVKGKSEPVRNFQIGHGIAEREQIVAHSELYGRQRELETVKALVDRVLAGNGAVLDIAGSRGIGKTRLTQELCTHASRVGMAVLDGAAISYGQSIPYLPWIAILRSLFDLTEDGESIERRREKIISGLDEAAAADWTPIVGSVLGIEIQENELTASLDARMRQQRFFDVVLQVIQARARHVPLVLALDDMHWADAVSLDLTTYVARNASASSFLLVVTRRPELETVPWDTVSSYRALYLNELDVQASLDLAQSVLDDLHPAHTTRISQPLRRVLLDRTQGNPLFVQEVTRALVESGGTRLEAGKDGIGTWVVADEECCAEVPTTLTGLIMSRIDRLQAINRRMIQVSSVIGVAFRPSVLARIYPYEDLDGTLGDRLNRLVQLDLLSLSPPDEYAFKHTLTHEVAYESLSFARRRALHVRVGEDIEEKVDGDLAEQYGVLAHHFERGQSFDKAFTYSIRAGHRAQSEYANEAALDYYGRAFEIGAGLKAPSSETQSQVLDIAGAMGDVYLLVSQYDQAVEQFERAMAHPMCTARRSSDLLRKIAQAHELQGQYDEALQHLQRGRTVLASNEQDQRSAEMARICQMFGQVHMRRGEVEQAITECRQGLTLVSRLARNTTILSIKADLHKTLGITHARLQGNWTEANKAFQQDTDLRQEAGDLPGLARSYNNLCGVSWAQGDLEDARDYLQRSLEISRQIGDNYMLALGYNNLGLIAYTTGDVEPALEHYHAALALQQRIGDSFGVAQANYNIGEAYLSLERYDEARQHLEQAALAFEAIHSEGELPEVYCLLAEIELAQANEVSALEHGTRARDIAANLGNSELQGIAERVIAQSHAQAGTAQQAMRSFEMSIELLGTSGNQIELARCHYPFGLWLREQAEHQELACEHLQRAIDLFAAASAEKEAAQACAALAECKT